MQGIHVSLQLLSALDRKHNGMMQVRQKRMQRRAKAKAAKANPLSGDGAQGEGLALDEDDEAMGAGAAELDAEREAREAEEIAGAADEIDEIQEKVCRASVLRTKLATNCDGTLIDSTVLGFFPPAPGVEFQSAERLHAPLGSRHRE